MVGRVEIVLSLVESFIELKYFHDVAMPALLCHKEPARSKQSVPKPLVGGFGCDELVLYGIRELAPATLSTNESQVSTFLDQ